MAILSHALSFVTSNRFSLLRVSTPTGNTHRRRDWKSSRERKTARENRKAAFDGILAGILIALCFIALATVTRMR